MFSNKVFSVLSLSALLLTSNSVFANQPNMSFAEIGFQSTEIDDLGSDFDNFNGFAIAGSYDFGNQIYISGEYSSVSQDLNDTFNNDFGGITEVGSSYLDVTLKQLRLGVGYIFEVSDSAIVTADINYIDLTADVDARLEITISDESGILLQDSSSGSESDGDNGVAARVQYQNMFTENFQVNLGLTYEAVRVDGESLNDTIFVAEGLYFFTENFAAKLSAAVGDNKQYRASLRYTF